MDAAMWQEVEDLETGGVVRWTTENLYRCDPYLVWADATTRLPDGPRSEADEFRLDIAVLVELDAAESARDFFARINSGNPDLAQLLFLPNGFEWRTSTRFVTGLVNRPGLRALIGDVVHGCIKRFTLQECRADIARTAQATWSELLELVNPILNRPQPAPRRSPVLGGSYLGIIDDGLPFLRAREAILHEKERPAHFWDQGWQPPNSVGSQMKPDQPPGPDDPYWTVAWDFFFLVLRPIVWLRGFLYGRSLKDLPTQSVSSPKGDGDSYAMTRYFDTSPRQTHGAGVLGLMAPWLSSAHGPVAWPGHVSGLAMVQLPTRTVLDTSGGSLAMRVLDGLRYILWMEERDRPSHGAARPTVANVSYGVHAGPHDGTSMFECAAKELLCENPHLHLVLPAGNAAQAGCHARRCLGPKDGERASANLALWVLPDNDGDTFVELWIPEGSEVTLALRPPGSATAYEVCKGEARVCIEVDALASEKGHVVRFGAVYAPAVAQGCNGTMILVAIGATLCVGSAATEVTRGLNQQPRRRVSGQAGLWHLRVTNRTEREIAVDAWVERGDAPPDRPSGSRQAYFPDSCEEAVRMRNATPEATLNGIATATHERLHVVGAMRADGALSDYSAAGPAGGTAARIGPDIVATADWSRSVPGLRTLGFVRGAIGRINGTSAACAVYARALALQLGTDPTQPVHGDPSPRPPPEEACVTDSQPQADPLFRGIDRRQVFPTDVDL